MTDVVTKPTEWRTEFPVAWTTVRPEPEIDLTTPAASKPAPLLLIPSQRTSPAIKPATVITIPDAPAKPRIPQQRRPEPDPEVLPSRDRRTKVLVMEGVLALVVAGAGIGVATTAGGSSTLTVHGAITIAATNVSGQPNYVVTNGGACSGIGQYADLVPGAAVWLVNAAGKPTAFGALGQSTLDPKIGCQLTWQVRNAPKQQTYRIVVGQHPVQVFTKAQLGRGFNIDVG